MNTKLLCTLSLAAFMTVACSSTAKKDGSNGASGSGSTIGGSGSDRDSGDRRLSSGFVSKSGLPTVVYFDFDSSDVKAADKATLDKWGALLKANPVGKVRLEGNTDERGTPEYNTALGERRGNSVRDELVKRGATAGQIIVISYGESKPVDTSHSEMAWSLNRRVEIVDINK